MASKPKPSTATFTLNTNHLRAALAGVGTAIGANPVLPIMEDVRFQIHPAGVRLSATDLSMWRIEEFAAMMGTTADFTLPFKQIKELIATLKSADVEITIEPSNAAPGSGAPPLNATLKYGRGKMTLPAYDGAAFPNIEHLKEKDATSFTINGNDLAAAFAKVKWAQVDTKDSRPFITSHMLALHPGKINVYATDRHDLAAISVQAVCEGEQHNIFAPAAVYGALLAFCTDKSTVNVAFDERRCVISDENGNAFGFQLPETPMREASYLSLRPTTPLFLFTVSAAEMIGSIKRALIAANDITSHGSLTLIDGAIRIESTDYDYARSASEEVAIELDTNGNEVEEGYTMNVNLTKLLRGLTAAGQVNDAVRFQISGPRTAFVYWPVTREDIWTLSMPIQ